jgi:C-terminal processing protease CtpA/Prc
MRFRLIATLLFCYLLISCSKNDVDFYQPQPTNTVQLIEAALAPTVTPTVGPTQKPTIVPPTTTPDISSEAYIYLEEALNIMEENSIHKYNVDWDAIRSQALKQADGAATPAETYITIQYTLERLGDEHSSFMTPAQVKEYKGGSFNDMVNLEPSGELIDNMFGYILLPGFAGMENVADNYATEIQNIIREIDKKKPCAWIVDLRNNPGGNMWPMLAGIGPILGDGCVGSFVDPDGQEYQWCYEDGVAYLDGLVKAKVNGTAYQIGESELPVAVLTGNFTMSSGEAIVVAFRGRPNTRSFGSSTGGFSTANDTFELSDGAWINLTGATFADRTGQLYGGKITPDVKVILNDEFPREVEKWLLEQPSCATDK